MLRLLRRKRDEKGQAMVEFALVLPLLLLILCGILDFGWLFYNQLMLNNADREATRVIVVNSSASDPTSLAILTVNKASNGFFNANNCAATVTYTNPNTKTDGDVTVVLTYKMNILTPVLGIFNGSQVKVLTSSVTMKMEN